MIDKYGSSVELTTSKMKTLAESFKSKSNLDVKWTEQFQEFLKRVDDSPSSSSSLYKMKKLGDRFHTLKCKNSPKAGLDIIKIDDIESFIKNWTITFPHPTPPKRKREREHDGEEPPSKRSK